MPFAAELASIPRQGSWIEIRPEKLLANLETLKRQNPSGAKVLAVIKANAYGHGLLAVARALQGQADMLGVSTVEEALELKENSIQTPVLLFGRLSKEEVRAVLFEDIHLTVSSFEEARDISELTGAAFGSNRKTPVHLKVDTGMGRLGTPYWNAFETAASLSTLPGILLEGIYTHFPTAEREDGFMEKQLRDFETLLGLLGQRGISFALRHAANSAASLRLPSSSLNLIRPGLMLYGIYPHDSLRQIAEVAPILAVKSRILLVKRLEAGQTAGYGRDFVAKRPTTLAVLPLGYSHGYPFRASSRGFALFRGKRFPLAGRVSMDYLSVDLGNETAEAGEVMTLLGEDGLEKITAEHIADWSGTIPYEVVTRLSPRLPRVVIG